jgi:hypothetical protein
LLAAVDDGLASRRNQDWETWHDGVLSRSLTTLGADDFRGRGGHKVASHDAVLSFDGAEPAVSLQSYSVQAISPDGTKVVAVERKGDWPSVVLALGADGTSKVVWRGEKPRGRGNPPDVVFHRDSRFALVQEYGERWHRVDLTTGMATAILGVDLDKVVQLSSDGRFGLTPHGLRRLDHLEANTGGSADRNADLAPRELPFSPPPQTFGKLGSTWSMGFGAGDRLVITPSDLGALVYRTDDRTLVGQFVTFSPGTWLFTTLATPFSGEGTASMELFGDLPEHTLWCRSGDRYLPWEVCRDRFVEPGLVVSKVRALGKLPQ